MTTVSGISYNLKEFISPKFVKTMTEFMGNKYSNRTKDRNSCYFIFVIGGTRDIGSSLTRLCFRQRSIENRLKSFTKFVLVLLLYFSVHSVYCSCLNWWIL